MHRCCHPHYRRCHPPPLLFLPVFLLNVLSKALAPLHCHGIAEPKPLLWSIWFVRASAAYVPPGHLFEAKCPPNCRHLDGGNGSGRLIQNGSSHCANTLLILDEFVSNPPPSILPPLKVGARSQSLLLLALATSAYHGRMALQTSVVVLSLSLLPPLAAVDVTAVALALASAVTIAAAAADVIAAIVVATAATITAFVINVVARLPHLCRHHPHFPQCHHCQRHCPQCSPFCHLCPCFAATTVINYAITLNAAIAFHHCHGCCRSHCHCHCHHRCRHRRRCCRRVAIVRRWPPPHFCRPLCHHLFCFLIVDCWFFAWLVAVIKDDKVGGGWVGRAAPWGTSQWYLSNNTPCKLGIWSFPLEFRVGCYVGCCVSCCVGCRVGCRVVHSSSPGMRPLKTFTAVPQVNVLA